MSDTSTRSGMLWEVERILTECYELGTLPRICLMENVPQVHSQDNITDFHKWQNRLEELGYKNYMQDLIATDYGIPQTRNRCFMVSILGDYSYSFPAPIPLKLKLKDMLEENVDEKYYLSDKMMDYIVSKDDKYQVNENKLVINREIACSKTTREGNTRADTSDYICEELEDNCNISNDDCLRRKMCNELIDQKKVKENDIVFINYTTRRYNEEDYFGGNNIAPTMTTRVCDDFAVVEDQSIKIKNANSKGYLEATEGDGIDISSRMEHHRGTVQKDKIQTLDTMGGESKGVVVLGGIGEKDSNNGTQWKQQNRIYDDKMAISITTAFNPYYYNNLRIRKLTPRECFRLMGVKDEDYEKCAKNQSNASLYHLAGDSIVCNILCHIFNEFVKKEDD